MNGISDGVAVVTGAVGGIGQAAAERFAEKGARVVAADVDGDGLEVTVEEIESAGGEATAVETDVTDKGSVRALVEETEETYGVPDMAFNNARIKGDNAPLVEQSIEDWDRTIAVNQTGVWLCLREELAAMAGRRRPERQHGLDRWTGRRRAFWCANETLRVLSTP